MIDLYLSTVPKATIKVHLILALSKYNVCPTLFIITTQIFKEHVEKKLPDKFFFFFFYLLKFNTYNSIYLQISN